MRDFHAERLKGGKRGKAGETGQPAKVEEHQKSPRDVPETSPSASVGSRFPHTVRMALTADLYGTLQELLSSAHAAGNYRYTSLAALVRAAFRAYRDGAPLTAGVASGPKRHSTLQLDEDLYAAYQKLPARKRWEILERAVRSFLKTL
ncbi:MAG TPA: hypothetical protein VLU25_12670 [Acidobacteriota bacterium]|nr:hypothetical protein [Acidobacteriota bacterium]